MRRKVEQAVAQSAPAAVAAAATTTNEPRAVNPTMSVLMEQASAAIAKGDFMTARTLLGLVRAMAPKDPYVAQRLALVTYKSRMPDPLQALREAMAIVSELNPEVSTDTETLGLWGAIHKRAWEETGDEKNLDAAILAYEKGFYLKNDYYNGMNLAFLYNLRASLSQGEQAVADLVLGSRIRKRVLTICESLLAPGVTMLPTEKYWVLATAAEACVGLGDEPKANEYLNQAKGLNQPAWMIESTAEQLDKLRRLVTHAEVFNQQTPLRA